MKTISFLNLKGGVGKTTSAINVAKGLANAGKKVLLIDIDPQANATRNFLQKHEIETDISTLLLNPTEDNIRKSLHAVDDNLHLIPSTLNLSMAETELRLRQDLPQQFRVRTIIDSLKRDFDYCIIDCPPIINLITINVVIASNMIILPIKVDIYAIEGYKITLEQIQNIKRNFHLILETRILFTMVNRNNTDKTIIASFSEDLKFVNTIRYQAKPVTEASFNNQLVIENIKSNVGRDYNNFITELIKEAD